MKRYEKELLAKEKAEAKAEAKALDTSEHRGSKTDTLIFCPVLL